MAFRDPGVCLGLVEVVRCGHASSFDAQNFRRADLSVKKRLNFIARMASVEANRNERPPAPRNIELVARCAVKNPAVADLAPKARKIAVVLATFDGPRSLHGQNHI